MWQSHVDIEGYSVMYFDRIAAFETPYRWTSIMGGAHIHFIDSLDTHASTKHVWTPPLMEAHMSSTLNGSSVIRCLKYSNMIEIRNEITFDFYTGLPHMLGYCLGKCPWERKIGGRHLNGGNAWWFQAPTFWIHDALATLSTLNSWGFFLKNNCYYYITQIQLLGITMCSATKVSLKVSHRQDNGNTHWK